LIPGILPFMSFLLWATVALILEPNLAARPRDARATFELLKKGSSLSVQDAEKFEVQVKKKPGDEDARVQLLSYYSRYPVTGDVAAVKAARARHILWVIENDPQDGLGLFQAATGVYRIHCQGDELADPESFKRASELWLKQVHENPGNEGIRREAAGFIQYCLPEEAEGILIAARDRSGLGRLYASAALGIQGLSYSNNDPAGSDPALRQRTFAEKAKRQLEETTDPDMLSAAAISLLRNGAILWADGKLDWDYTSLGNNILGKARSATPDVATLLTLPTTLPARGERPPLTLRIGGGVQAANLVRKVSPPYPLAARNLGIQGVVKMTALLGLDGKVLHLKVESGPAELVQASVDAVRQWEYRPTMLNGKPCYVITQIDVNFTLSPVR
jgi:hypothetical protein